MPGSDTIQVNSDEYLRLVSAKLVLDTLSNSVKSLKDEIKQRKEEQHQQTEKVNNESPEKTATNNNNAVSAKRKYLNTKRWHCVSRPQYKYSCGISSLVSCWNYLFSKELGHGTHPEILTQEKALEILGYEPPYSEIRFGPFTGNATLMRWFDKLNDHFGVSGRASFFYKPVGTHRTPGLTSKAAKERLEVSLKSKTTAFIYHCYNHYCCPVGFDKESTDPAQIYEVRENKDESLTNTRILLADTSRKFPTFHSVAWTDIETDLSLTSPEFLNIRHLERGIQTRKGAEPKVEVEEEENNNNKKKQKEGRNLHCIMKFERCGDDSSEFLSYKE